MNQKTNEINVTKGLVEEHSYEDLVKYDGRLKPTSPWNDRAYRGQYELECGEHLDIPWLKEQRDIQGSKHNSETFFRVHI